MTQTNYSESPKLLPAKAFPSQSGQESVFPQFDRNQHTVEVIEKWGAGWHLKYIPMPNGEVVILELDGEPPPFVLTESGKAITVGDAGDSR